MAQSGFIRPEVLALARRHRATLIALACGLAGGWLIRLGLGTAAPFLTLLGAVILCVTLALWLAQQQRARFRRAVDQPGLVQIDEAQIRYFGPDIGGIVDRDALTRVELVSSGDGIAHWRLSRSDGPPVAVPLSAEGADALVDVLMTLPGVQVTAALSALDRRRRAVVPVWSRTKP